MIGNIICIYKRINKKCMLDDKACKGSCYISNCIKYNLEDGEIKYEKSKEQYEKDI